ncbi:MAG: hypothetical protein DDT29_02354 [Dehalococcoidia bacterium]|nr:hypothetical protein [Bacillota bacterium]
MSWRNHSTHREETKAVKLALKEAGIPFTKVGHGTGSAWSWLEIYLGTHENYNEHGDHALAIARRVTGRKGDYDGGILVIGQQR